MSTSSAAASVPPANADDSTKATAAHPQSKADEQPDAQPSLESMVSATWEITLSFLPPLGISAMSHRISKSLGAGEDKADASEKAAKLALENMMAVAWSILRNEYDHDVPANDDYISDNCDIEELKKITKFEDESFLRTYHLATVLSRAGKLMADKIGATKDIALEGGDKHCPLLTTMWLLYGRPALPTLSKAGVKIAESMEFALVKMFGSPYRSGEDYGFLVTADAEPFCRQRMLWVAERLARIGLFPGASSLLTVVAPRKTRIPAVSLAPKHIYGTEYPPQCEVVLRGLSKEDLNGKTGVVKRVYNVKTGRIGVALVDEATGARRVVGLKPINIDHVEEDNSIAVDAKIMHAEILFLSLLSKKGFTPISMPSIIHMLRGVAAKLREKIEETESYDNEKAQVENVRSMHYPSELHRLFFADVYLGFLLVTIANYTAMEQIPHDFDGLICQDYDDILSIGDEDEDDDNEDTHWAQTVSITRNYLHEGASALMRCDKNLKQLQEKFGKGLYSEQMSMLLARAQGLMHEVAGYLSEGLGVAFVPLNWRGTRNLGVGEQAERTATEHAMVATACYRTKLESLLEIFAKTRPGQPLTIGVICSNGKAPHFVKANLVYFAVATAEIYDEIYDVWENAPFFPDGERNDTAMFIKLAFLVSMQMLGPSHPMMDKIRELYGDVVVAGNDVVEHHRRFNQDFASGEMEASVNEWLKSYVPLYYGTSRQHPALYQQLISQGGDEDESDNSDDEDDAGS